MKITIQFQKKPDHCPQSWKTRDLDYACGLMTNHPPMEWESLVSGQRFDVADLVGGCGGTVVVGKGPGRL